jgi:Fic family protein
LATGPGTCANARPAVTSAQPSANALAAISRSRGASGLPTASKLLLLQAGYAYVPYSSLESVIEQNKDAYYLALRQTQGTIRTESPNWQPWLVFFLRSLAEQVRHLEKKVEREKIVLAAMPTLQLQIVELAREHGRVTIGEAITLTGASRNALKQHFRALVERGTLNRHGSGRGIWYDLR